MSHAVVWNEHLRLNNPVFVEGLPGLGLVGKLATDHLIDQFGMTYYASIECPSLPQVGAYHGDDHRVLPAVRIYADERRDLLALQSDVAVSPQTVSDFASCLTGFLVERNALPINFSGIARDETADSAEERSLCGVATGGGEETLAALDIEPPSEAGLWSGPTGAMLNVARTEGITSLGLIVEADPERPDPEAACTLIEDGIVPVAGIDVDVDPLREAASEIRENEQALAERMRESEADESSKAESLRMYQ
ncbi:proteasome assembly chaperone family protein [Halosimplex salinum]|uniref:proteasome assembly chaperone family protein n=1 Tax=Halosimplex salinum TaxID=1710538 RepID=UPI000F4A2A28|nr:PAC2 family protein [Halosimplex salinum]